MNQQFYLECISMNKETHFPIKLFKPCLAISTLIALTGCGPMNSFYNRDVIEDKMRASSNNHQEIGTLAVTSDRRLIIGNLKDGTFCSEPPPETADSVTSAMAAALQANISEDKNLNAEIASNFAQHVNQLYKRSHVVQFLRDAAFYYCVDAVNAGAASGAYASYKESIDGLVKTLAPKLNNEVANYYAVEKARAENSSTSHNTSMIICNSTASAGSSTALSTATGITCQPLNLDTLKAASEEPPKEGDS